MSTPTYIDLVKEVEVLRALLVEAVIHGTHHPDCACLTSFSVDSEGHILTDLSDEEVCNCWMKAAHVYLNAPEVVITEETVGICECNHSSHHHANNANRLCVTMGCSCMEFRLKETV
jgi:hypothetical protein